MSDSDGLRVRIRFPGLDAILGGVGRSKGSKRAFSQFRSMFIMALRVRLGLKGGGRD